MSNPPPGMTDYMIPGNRPEDKAWEEWASMLDEAVGASGPEVLELWASLLCEVYEARLVHACYELVAALLGKPSFFVFLNGPVH